MYVQTRVWSGCFDLNLQFIVVFADWPRFKYLFKRHQWSAVLPVLVLNSWLMRPNERQPKRGSKVSQCGQFGGARVTTDTVTLAAHICGSSWSAQGSGGDMWSPGIGPCGEWPRSVTCFRSGAGFMKIRATIMRLCITVRSRSPRGIKVLKQIIAQMRIRRDGIKVSIVATIARTIAP